MDETEQLIAVIRDKNTSIDRLNDMVSSINAQISRSERALNLLNQSDPDTFTYDLYQEVLQIGSGGETSSITRSEFDLLLPEDRLEARNGVKKNIETAISAFQRIKNEITTELSKRQGGVSMEKDFCSNCGKEISPGAKFCTHCGTPASVATEIKPQAEASVATEIKTTAEASVATEIITAENVSLGLLKSIFDAAYMKAEVSGNLLIVKEGIACAVTPAKEQNRVQLMTMWGLKPETNNLERLECANALNTDIIILRAAVSGDNLVCTYDMLLDGGISKAAFVLQVKRFCTIAPVAVSGKCSNIMK